MRKDTAKKETILVLITFSYPYGAIRESFLDPEISCLCSYFNKIILVPQYLPDATEKIARNLPKVCVLDDSLIIYSKIGKIRSVLMKIFLCLRSKLFYTEIIKKPAIITNIKSFKLLGEFISDAFIIKKWASNCIKKHDFAPQNTIFYTYWLSASTLGLGLLKEEYPDIVVISRAHRGDLYEDQYSSAHITLRNETFSLISKVFLISNSGKEYLEKKYPTYLEKYQTIRLGVTDSHFITSPSVDGIFRIVSCSYIVPVKRLHLLINGLKEFCILRPSKRIEWTHIGYGPLEQSIKKLASEVLPENVKYNFTGFLPDKGVIEYYRQHNVDVFINVSASEGIPVSIMEAQSCGIPVIATDVGGTHEIVSDEVGLLLDSDPTPMDIADAILKFIDNPNQIADKKRKSKENWRLNYNAEVNHNFFAQEIANLRN
ncbi:Glycosyl transferase, group 1 family protein [Methanosarcina barkeri str. Wiesmoor]|uniref:Glycosyl transferase, group 1 family protein n=2 Tax=Methanosarcina barkeri TaxID=2208 RepID=A0A0E3QN86_METBA|nr:glycosyltransferase [Methanosarcina barkeri]AKB51857.1 Glycosyl transferase, group 1 family protein [Methanosarcina barkeri str. Wiesmoor]